MTERRASDALAVQAAQEQYVRDVANISSSTAEQLETLARLRDNGSLTEEEFPEGKRQTARLKQPLKTIIPS